MRVRSNVIQPCGRFSHTAALYGSSEEFLATVVPFVAEGLAAGEPTLVVLDVHLERLLHRALGPAPALIRLDWAEHYTHPFAALNGGHTLVLAHLAAGAKRVRVVGEPPYTVASSPWEGWARFEAAINHVFAKLPVCVLCPYDTRVISAEVRADVEHTHGELLRVSGRRPSPCYTDPDVFLAERARSDAALLDGRVPDVRLRDPTIAQARHAVGALAATTSLSPSRVQDAMLAVSEVVTNAIVYGQSPVEVRAWRGDDGVAVRVHDRGPGPGDPFAGLLPADSGGISGGLGLWLAHRVSDTVSLAEDETGFAVQLVVGTPPATQ